MDKKPAIVRLAFYLYSLYGLLRISGSLTIAYRDGDLTITQRRVEGIVLHLRIQVEFRQVNMFCNCISINRVGEYAISAFSPSNIVLFSMFQENRGFME